MERKRRVSSLWAGEEEVGRLGRKEERCARRVRLDVLDVMAVVETLERKMVRVEASREVVVWSVVRDSCVGGDMCSSASDVWLAASSSEESEELMF